MLTVSILVPQSSIVPFAYRSLSSPTTSTISGRQAFLATLHTLNYTEVNTLLRVDPEVSDDPAAFVGFEFCLWRLSQPRSSRATL